MLWYILYADWSAKAANQTEENGPTADIYSFAGVGIFPLKTVILEMGRVPIQVNTLIEIEEIEGNTSCYKEHETQIHQHLHHSISKQVGSKLKELGLRVEFKSLVNEKAHMNLDKMAELEFSNGWASDESVKATIIPQVSDIATIAEDNMMVDDPGADVVNPAAKTVLIVDDILEVDKPENIDLNLATGITRQEVEETYWYSDIDYEEDTTDGCCVNCECVTLPFNDWLDLDECVTSMTISEPLFELNDEDTTFVADDNQAAWLIITTKHSIIIALKTRDPTRVEMIIGKDMIHFQGESCMEKVRIQQPDCLVCLNKVLVSTQSNSRFRRSMFTRMIGAVDEDDFKSTLVKLQQQEKNHESQILENQQSILDYGRREAVLNRKRLNDLVSSLERKICSDVSQMKSNRLANLLEEHASEITMEIASQLTLCYTGHIPPMVMGKFHQFCMQSYPKLCQDSEFYQAFIQTAKCQPLGVMISNDKIVVSMQATVPDGPKTAYNGFLVLSLPVFGKNSTMQLDVEPGTILITTENGSTTAIGQCQTVGVSPFDFSCEIKNIKPKSTNCIDAVSRRKEINKQCWVKLPDNMGKCFAKLTPFGILVSTDADGLTVMSNEERELNGFKSREESSNKITGVRHLDDKAGPIIKCNSITYRANKRRIQLELKETRHFNDKADTDMHDTDGNLDLWNSNMFNEMAVNGQGYQTWAQQNTINTVLDSTSFEIGKKKVTVRHVIKFILVSLVVIGCMVLACMARYVTKPCQWWIRIKKCCPCQSKQNAERIVYQPAENIPMQE